jgi:glycerol-3-phosphate acyltransferase PlsY
MSFGSYFVGTSFSYIIGALLFIGSYFTGNINPAIIIGRIHGVDVRSEGSGNAGTTNAIRTIGKKAGALTFAIDVLKGWGPLTAITHILGIENGGAEFAFLCGIFIIIGHMWPVVFGFKGGKGVATAFGILLFLDWRLALALIGVVIALTLATRIVSLSVLVACVLAIPLSYILDRPYLPGVVIIIALVVFKHRANIGRIIRGEEPKLSVGNKDQ